MSIFGWSYPPGCSGTPYDDEDDGMLIDPEKLRTLLQEELQAHHHLIAYRIDDIIEEGQQEVASGLFALINGASHDQGYSIAWINITEAKDWLEEYDQKIKEENEAEVARIEEEIQAQKDLEEYERAMIFIGMPEDAVNGEMARFYPALPYESEGHMIDRMEHEWEEAQWREETISPGSPIFRYSDQCSECTAGRMHSSAQHTLRIKLTEHNQKRKRERDDQPVGGELAPYRWGEDDELGPLDEHPF